MVDICIIRISVNKSDPALFFQLPLEIHPLIHVLIVDVAQMTLYVQPCWDFKYSIFINHINMTTVTRIDFLFPDCINPIPLSVTNREMATITFAKKNNR